MNRLTRFTTISLVVQLLTCTCFCQHVKELRIVGSFNRPVNRSLYIRYDLVPGESRMVSGSVSEGRFDFALPVAEPSIAVISLENNVGAHYFFLDTNSSAIRFSLEMPKDSATGSLKLVSVEGSESHRIFEYLNQKWQSLNLLAVDHEWRSNEKYRILDSLVAIGTLHDNNLISRTLFFSDDLNFYQASSIFSRLSETQKQRAERSGLKQMLARLEKTEQGKRFVVNEVFDMDRKPVDISKILKKRTLISFWASWCGPCRAKHPAMQELYRKYQQEGFQLISISLDENTDEWQKASKKDGIDWTNLIVENGFQSPVASGYLINYVPYLVLLDQEGKILLSNVLVSELPAMLDQ